MRTVLTSLGLVLVGTFSATAAGGLEGNWSRGDGKAQVKIAPCGSDICATNTWIKPGTSREKVGDRLVMSLRQNAEGSYAGTAFDPQRDMTYKVTVTVSGDSMTTRGCVIAGLVCRSVDWSRAK